MLCLKVVSFNFDLKFFLSNMQLKIIVCCVTDQPSIAWSRRSVLKLKFSVLTFLMLRLCSMSSGQNLYKEMKGSTPIHVQCDNMYWPKVWSHHFWYILYGLIWTWAVWEWQYPKNCQWGFRLQNMTSLIHRLGRSFQQLFKWLIKQLF